jgi:hypothetical protein
MASARITPQTVMGKRHSPKTSCHAKPSLYVYCHPELSAASHFRREWVKKQSKKKPNPNGTGVPESFDNYMQSVCTDTELDGLGFLQNFRGWNSFRTVLPVTIDGFHDENKIAAVFKFTGFDAPTDFLNQCKSKLTTSCLDNVWKTMQNEATGKFNEVSPTNELLSSKSKYRFAEYTDRDTPHNKPMAFVPSGRGIKRFLCTSVVNRPTISSPMSPSTKTVGRTMSSSTKTVRRTKLIF